MHLLLESRAAVNLVESRLGLLATLTMLRHIGIEWDMLDGFNFMVLLVLKDVVKGQDMMAQYWVAVQELNSNMTIV